MNQPSGQIVSQPETPNGELTGDGRASQGLAGAAIVRVKRRDRRRERVGNALVILL